MADLICTPTPGNPEQWTITAGTQRGRSWWDTTNRPRLSEYLGDTTYCRLDVDQLVREADRANLLVSVNGNLSGTPGAWLMGGPFHG